MLKVFVTQLHQFTSQPQCIRVSVPPHLNQQLVEIFYAMVSTCNFNLHFLNYQWWLVIMSILSQTYLLFLSLFLSLSLSLWWNVCSNLLSSISWDACLLIIVSCKCSWDAFIKIFVAYMFSKIFNGEHLKSWWSLLSFFLTLLLFVFYMEKLCQNQDQ